MMARDLAETRIATDHIAYHLRTDRREQYDARGLLDMFTLNTIFVPDQRTVVGIIPGLMNKERAVIVVNLSYPKSYLDEFGREIYFIDEAQTAIGSAITPANDLETRVVSKVGLDINTIEKIAFRAHFSEQQIPEPFDPRTLSTEYLVDILAQRNMNRFLNTVRGLIEDQARYVGQIQRW